ncbi:type II toxin-antitoxin system PemK/MazF family toxin [Corynebacterium freneyi]|uniref:type II toxin-antitoxin system PemK/MazF family toxin n=1 Tax=Corynebacterium freneyi TaxID=134034 RepID=UPI00254A0AD9|nr:type II toxin-antitoxin system PemK/MazF family toxin [Corynebacterium freneyi]MDK8768165.1 type II toxin-antitoxin system PemK/MazF family toxin [Corynebacterium freneyi]
MTPPEPDATAADPAASGSGLTAPDGTTAATQPERNRRPAADALHRAWDRARTWAWHRIIAATEWFRGGDTLDRGLEMLNEQLGLMPDDSNRLANREAATVARPTADLARSIVYAPDMDGQTDPGEVVWAPVMLEGDAEKSRERAVVVVGRHKQILLGALISTHDRHADSPHWLFIGSGAWDPEGRPSWVRLDKILEVPESGIRRSGAIMPRRRFDRIAARLRSDYHWS